MRASLKPLLLWLAAIMLGLSDTTIGWMIAELRRKHRHDPQEISLWAKALLFIQRTESRMPPNG